MILAVVLATAVIVVAWVLPLKRLYISVMGCILLSEMKVAWCKIPVRPTLRPAIPTNSINRRVRIQV